jgi:hypothetical protein
MTIGTRAITNANANSLLCEHELFRLTEQEKFSNE